MARSSTYDPIEKFRFKLTVIELDFSVGAALQTASSVLPAGNTNKRQLFTVVARGGFQEITLPRATVNEISYRENTDAQRFSKIPGLVKYDPIFLRRGSSIGSSGTGHVEADRDLYNWYKLVNNDLVLMGAAQELLGKASAPPKQTISFRREVVVEVIDRAGTSVKQWVLFNAFPISYKGGDDLNANSEDKLIEEISLTYEFFVELPGGLSDVGTLAREIVKDLAEGVLDNLDNTATGNLPSTPPTF